ncbi:hypothetical protein [Burkholderia pseudomallei]|uniref:hypothetical protein n=1 Tax=Burkholderia pseudomallei TaxID=28450 RepID=UPI000FBA02E4|nr:hypothetical protein [Burkholderia pseudomallei]RPE23017.1 hypothetical protein DF127_05710 [Burkholderia pseudomallei]RQS99016.1 hypothetical protein DF125_02860 [Burkholderia pseudomallei]
MLRQPWIDYETTRDAYLTAALVFGRADLLAAVLLDSASPNQSAAWGRFFAAGEVYRTLTPQVLGVLIDHVPADVLNVLLGTDLPGDLASVPVWVAMLLAARPAPEHYKDVLARLAFAGATGFGQHLGDGKHPVLMNRDALNKAIGHATRTAESMTRKTTLARSNAAASILDEYERRVHVPIGNEGKAPPAGKEAGILAIINGLHDLVETEQQDGAGLLGSMEQYLDEAEVRMANYEKRQAARNVDAPLAQISDIGAAIDHKLGTWGMYRDLTLDQENQERERLALPPRVVAPRSRYDVQRRKEWDLIQAIQVGRMKDITRLLNEGVNPDTPNFLVGMALCAALLRNPKLAAMLLAQGANPLLRPAGLTMITHVARAAAQRLDGGFIDHETMEDTMDTYAQSIGLLVRAGATASQMNVQQTASDPVDAWHWLRQVPLVEEAYLEALEVRQAAVQEAEQAVKEVQEQVRRYPDEEKQAAAAVAAMLGNVKRAARGG